ncbi:SDR family oxidoreductase [bacterium]|nr:MAG: SDR family oxidoreductase [bacterium]
MSDRPKILLTGATGMIGSLLAEALVAKGVPFSAMVRSIEGAKPLGDMPGVTLVRGDFDDPASLTDALKDMERAFLLTNSSERTEQQQKGFVEAAAKAGVGHVVKLSQFATAPESPVRFLRYHAAVEAALRESGLAWTFLRPNLIFQAYLPFASMVKQGYLQAPIGDAPVSVVDARDIAAVAVAALTERGHEGQTYTLTGPMGVTHAEIAAAFGRAGGQEVRFGSAPPEEFGALLKGVGMPIWQVEGLLEDYAHYDRGEAAAVSPDVERVTGEPARSLETFARDHAEAF